MVRRCGNLFSVPMPSRPSLSPDQIRDPIGTLANAYGVERDMQAVTRAIALRAFPQAEPKGYFPDDFTIPNEWGAVSQMVAVFAQDGRNLGRVFRSSPLPRPYRQTARRMVSCYVGDEDADGFIEIVATEIRSSLIDYLGRP